MINVKVRKTTNPNISEAYDGNTNDPIAVIRSGGNGRHKVQADWHPVFKMMYPEVTKHLTLMNIGESESMSSMTNRIHSRYDAVLSGDVKDPLDARYVGRVEKSMPSDYEEPITRKFHQYALHDHEGNHLANLFVGEHFMQHVGVNHDVFSYATSAKGRAMYSHVEYPGEKPTNEHMERMWAKHPGHDPISAMQRIDYWNKNKEREPSFVGQYTAGNHQVYKTKLNPEQAATKFMEHMQSKHTDTEFKQLSPTHIVGVKKSTGAYNPGVHHFIDTSEPGVVRHVKTEMVNPNHYSAKQLSTVIE